MQNTNEKNQWLIVYTLFNLLGNAKKNVLKKLF